MNELARPADAYVGQPARGGFDDRHLSPVMLAVLWLFLVALAVVGRAWQPVAHVTPLAAVSLAAGAIFPSTMLAASVPVVALALGNLFLPPHESLAMAVIVSAALAWPVVIGRLGLLGGAGRNTKWFAVIGGALASSLVFYFATNVAHWLLTDMYPKSAAGLVACLVAALPFHRWMPVGDMAWSLALFGLLAGMVTAGDALAARRLSPARVSKKPESTSVA
ncbi:MAG: DUF6580 family putative transport protein [Planctomycetota bacterium]